MTIDWQYKASKWNKSPHKHNNLRYTSNLLKINIYEWKSQIHVYSVYGKMMNQNLLHLVASMGDDVMTQPRGEDCSSTVLWKYVFCCFLNWSTHLQNQWPRLLCVSQSLGAKKSIVMVSSEWVLSPAAVLERPPATQLSTRQGLCVKDRRWWVDTPGQRRMAQHRR